MCISNDACRPKRRQLRVASAAATSVAADLQKACVTSVAAADVGLCLAALLFRDRPATTSVTSGQQIDFLQSFRTPPTKAPPRHLEPEALPHGCFWFPGRYTHSPFAHDVAQTAGQGLGTAWSKD